MDDITLQFSEIGLRTQLYLSITCVLINIPHLFILTRSSMRTSSTNSILIGISVFDSIVLLIIINERVHQYWIAPRDNLCVNFNTYGYEMVRLVGDFLSASFERGSFWLGIFLAFIRLLITRTSFESLTKPIIGYSLILVTLLVSASFSAFNFSKWTVLEAGYWEPDAACPGYSSNYTEPTYYQATRRGYKYEEFFAQYNFIDGMSRICVSVIYPVLALFLFLEVWKNAKYAAAALSKKETVERFRTARMILVMTFFYIITSISVGVPDFVQLFMTVKVGTLLEMMIGFSYIFNNILFCLNAMSHSILNFVMSSQYRNTVKIVLGWKK